MRMTRPRPILATILFGLMVSVSTGVINGVLGLLLTGGAGDISDMLMLYLQRGYELEEAWEQVVLEMIRQGPGFIFGILVGGTVLFFLIALWQALLNVGYTGYALSMARGENPSLETLFCAFPIIGPVLITRVLTGVFLFLWGMLLCVCWFALIFAGSLLIMMINSEALLVLFMLAVMVALWVGIFWITLRYALVDYVVLDKGLSGMDAIRESRRLMRGRTGQAFLLKLSFAGWYFLLVVIVYTGAFLALAPLMMQASLGGGGELVSIMMMLGIGGLTVLGVALLAAWLRPYASGTVARFYDWAKAQADGLADGSGFGPGPGAGSWGGPSDYTWTTGPSSGTGTGGGHTPGGWNGGQPRPPKPPKDDPWS